jgi:hypothetical protein
MQDKAGGRDGVLATHGREQGGRVRVTLRRVYRPAHDAAAPDVHDEVQIPEEAPQRALEVRDIPAPHLLWSRRAMRGGPQNRYLRRRTGSVANELQRRGYYAK